MAAIGSVWAAGTWADDVWGDGTWGAAIEAVVAPPAGGVNPAVAARLRELALARLRERLDALHDGHGGLVWSGGGAVEFLPAATSDALIEGGGAFALALSAEVVADNEIAAIAGRAARRAARRAAEELALLGTRW